MVENPPIINSILHSDGMARASNSSCPFIAMLSSITIACFPKTKKAVKRFLLNCLIFSVDQLGLEPRTSRL